MGGIQPDQRIELEDLAPFTREVWRGFGGPGGPARTELKEFQDPNLALKIELERNAVSAMFETKSQKYVAELGRLAKALPAMPDERVLQICCPAYNEQDSIRRFLDGFVEPASAVNPRSWGMIITINRTISGDAERDANNAANMEATVHAINEFKAEHPELPIEYVCLTVSPNLSGLSIARLVGHDLTALRSSQRDQDSRVAPMYIQTLDADTPKLNPHFFELIANRLERDKYALDSYRQDGQFPVEDLRAHPLLHSMGMFWNETLGAIAKNSDSAWTVGRGVLVGLYPHALTGGVFPFKHARAADEDLRLGNTISGARGHGVQGWRGQIDEPMFDVDPRRERSVIGDLLLTLQERGFPEKDIPLTRDIHDIATLLRSYVDEPVTLERGKFSPKHDDLAWQSTPELFEQAVPRRALELIANSWRELIRVELALDDAKEIVSPVAGVYDKYARGDEAYAIMRRNYNGLEQDILDNPAHADEMRAILERASEKSSVLMAEILERQGIRCEVVPVPATPPGKDADSLMPEAIRILDTEGYRKKLVELL